MLRMSASMKTLERLASPRRRAPLIGLPSPRPNKTSASTERISGSRGTPQHLIFKVCASLAYWLIAHSYFVPGLYFQRYSFALGLALASKRGATLPEPLLCRILSGTLASTKYFEFDFAWRAFPNTKSGNYLDVLSPWLLPLLVIQRERMSHATVVSSDRSAMSTFAQLLDTAGLAPRCEILSQPLDRCALAPGSFDLITNISGLAKVTDDSKFLETMWNLLKPGGRLIVSVPCNAAVAVAGADDGFVSSSLRSYDPALLRDRIFSVVGEPAHAVVYGETCKSDCDTAIVAPDPEFPSPREPLVIARKWRCFSRVEDLPGRGVTAMVFHKPGDLNCLSDAANA